MKQVLQALTQILGIKNKNNLNLPKRKIDKTLKYESGITCIICESENIEITEQGLCEICGNVIM